MDVVEKDYVLGWLLAGITAYPETASQWVFKGGTCLKKCWFETYRFSEDLDFSLLPGALYTAVDLMRILRGVAERTSELSGIEFILNDIAVREQRNLQNQPTFGARIPYRGPLGIPTIPRVRLDITRQEPVLDGVARRPVIHAYPDALPAKTMVAAYSIDELFAEKTRALLERTRPRDLYDVDFILNNRPDALNLERVRELLREKCRVKAIPAPTATSLTGTIEGAAELRSEWGNMLAHQLPNLPPIESLLARVPSLLVWIDRPAAMSTPALQSAPIGADLELVAAAGLVYWGTGVPIEALRFAGTNRLKVEFTYSGRHRVAEPYAMRRASGTGNLLFYAYEDGADNIKAYKISEMSGVRATSIPFTPRYRVEFVSSGPIEAPSAIPPSHTHPTRARSRGGPSSRGSTKRQSRRPGPVHVYQCVRCGKRFRRSQRNSTIRAHKDPSGHRCPGRHGRYVDTRY